MSTLQLADNRQTRCVADGQLGEGSSRASTRGGTDRLQPGEEDHPQCLECHICSKAKLD